MNKFHPEFSYPQLPHGTALYVYRWVLGILNLDFLVESLGEGKRLKIVVWLSAQLCLQGGLGGNSKMLFFSLRVRFKVVSFSLYKNWENLIGNSDPKLGN